MCVCVCVCISHSSPTSLNSPRSTSEVCGQLRPAARAGLNGVIEGGSVTSTFCRFLRFHP